MYINDLGHFFLLTDFDIVLILVVGTGLKEEPKISSFPKTRFRFKIAVKLCQHLLNQRKFHALLFYYLVCCLASHQLFEIQVVHSITVVLDFKLQSLFLFVEVCCYRDATSLSCGQTKLYQPDNHLLYPLAVAPQLQIGVYFDKICPDLNLRFPHQLISDFSYLRQKIQRRELNSL